MIELTELYSPTFHLLILNLHEHQLIRTTAEAALLMCIKVFPRSQQSKYTSTHQESWYHHLGHVCQSLWKLDGPSFHNIIPQHFLVMPESFVLAFFHQEINLHSSDVGKTSKLPYSHPSEHGIPLPHMSHFYVTNALILKYIQIPYCLQCAQINGNCQTVTLHRCKPDDLLFHILPKVRKRLSNTTKKTNKELEEEEKDRFICKACVQLDSEEDEDEDKGLDEKISGVTSVYCSSFC